MDLMVRIAMGLVMAAGSLQVHWHQSTAVGSHTAGRLEHGVRLPAEGHTFFTWDAVRRRSPNRAWRRWGLDWGQPTSGEHTVASRAFDTRGRVQPAADDPEIANKLTYWESNGQITRRVRIP